MSKCACTLAGYCHTHQRVVSEIRHQQCKNEPGYFEAFQRDAEKRKEHAVQKAAKEESGPNDGANCIHRGPLIENRKCDTCGNRGTYQPVYQCSLYGECSDWQKFKTVHSCRWCPDFSPREDHSQSS